jgi:hypothetical protein
MAACGSESGRSDDALQTAGFNPERSEPILPNCINQGHVRVLSGYARLLNVVICEAVTRPSPAVWLGGRGLLE